MRLLFGSALWVQNSPVQETLERGKQQFPFMFTVALLTVGYRLTRLEATKSAPVAFVLAVKRTSILCASFIVIYGFIILRSFG